jgi:HPt (histidine-containing phosphotransfer) domain-containing protein
MQQLVLDPAAIDRLVLAFGEEGRSVVAELVDTFLAEAPSRLEALRHGIASGDPREVHRAAHSLKSGAATLGASDLADVCREVEARGGAGDVAGAAVLVPAVETGYVAARQALLEAVG